MGSLWLYWLHCPCQDCWMHLWWRNYLHHWNFWTQHSVLGYYPQMPSRNSSPWTCLWSCFGTNGRWYKVSVVFISERLQVLIWVLALLLSKHETNKWWRRRNTEICPPQTPQLPICSTTCSHPIMLLCTTNSATVIVSVFESNLNIIFMIGLTLHLQILRQRYTMQFFIMELGAMPESGSKSALQLKKWRTLLGNMFTAHNLFSMGLLGFVQHDSSSSLH